MTGIFEDKYGQILFATMQGLITFLGNENKWELLTSENSYLPGEVVTCIFEDKDSKLWLGTGQGIVVLEPFEIRSPRDAVGRGISSHQESERLLQSHRVILMM